MARSTTSSKRYTWNGNMKGAATEPQCFEKAKKLRVLDTQTLLRATNSYADLRDMNMTPASPHWLMSIHHMYTLSLIWT